ncbi:MAG: M1 family metallopeptidase [Chitinophagaceae bacterium]|nr:M1 family metallopeptidase [Chitinophagaceae bacterium]
MKKFFVLLLFLMPFSLANAQQNGSSSTADTAWKKIYRGTYPIISNLVHTKLDVRFDIPKAIMSGQAWITLKPHFYPTDSLTLDAKYMDIKEVAVVKGNTKSRLNYSYDSLQLHIHLDKTYKKDEQYIIYINYISRPNEFKSKGSAAITDDKGLYFINPDGKGKFMTQIWTQGETESNSVWMPTIDKPDQKTTEEISMTVPSGWVTLSNGLMVSQKKNTDGTRTDTWKLDLPNSPYLFFMGAGEFAIVKDKYKNIPVNYYVEKEWAPVAKKIFGETPNMIGFFSKILDFPYAWPKYDQMVGREFVSGAMENTTATLHQDGAYQNARQLVDGNSWENVIAHELFHHWFGDLVTTESWSNITVNESFADYAEYLWTEYRHGKDAADEVNYNEMQGYLMSNSSNKDLVRFHYQNREDVFDAVSYNKGGRILHMLRNFVGDDAFFASLNRYLTLNKFQPAEAQNLRLAFEKVTGKDMNWFWNEWYYGSGEPHLTIQYNYENGKERVVVNQTQKGRIFTLPVKVDVYSGADQKQRYNVWLRNASDTFYFNSTTKPTWVNVDADKVLLAVKNDQKGMAEFEQQYKYGSEYLDRREALEYFAAQKSSNLVQGLSDKYSGLRTLTMDLLQSAGLWDVPSTLGIIEKVAQNDPDKKTKAKALEILAKTKDSRYLNLFEKNLMDSSYSVAGAALQGYAAVNPDKAYEEAKVLSLDAEGALADAVSDIMFKSPDPADFDILYNIYANGSLSEGKLMNTMKFANYLAGLSNTDQVKKGALAILDLRNQVPSQYRENIDPLFKQAFGVISAAQSRAGKTDIANYIQNLMK